MKKIISVILMVMTVLICFSACKSSQGKTPKTVDVANKIKESADFSELIALNDDNITRRYYGIDLEKIEEYTALVCSSGALADEISVFKMKDRENVEEMLKVVRERKQELYNSFVDYVPEETDKIENAIIGSNGNYVYLIVCTERAKAKSACESLF